MAMNSSVAAGRIVQTTSKEWLPWVNLAGRGLDWALYFQRNQNNAPSVTTNTMAVNGEDERPQVVDVVARSDASSGSPMLHAGQRAINEHAHAEDRHQQEDQTPKLSATA